MKNTLKLIFALLIIVLVIIVIRSLPKKEVNKHTTEDSPKETLSPTATTAPVITEKPETNEELLDRLEADSDINYTTQLNAIETETK